MNIRFPALAALFTALVLSACASNPPAPDTKVAEQKVECERTYKTGSMMPKKDCAPPLTDEERRQMQDEVANRIRQSNPRPPSK